MYFYSNDLLGYIPAPLLLAIVAIMLLPFVMIAISAAFGLSLPRLRPGIVLLYLLLASYILPHVFILSEDRFHLALVPFIAILAAYAWSEGRSALSARWQESLAGKIAVSFSVLVVFLLLANWAFELSRDGDKIAALLAPGGNQTYFPY